MDNRVRRTESYLGTDWQTNRKPIWEQPIEQAHNDDFADLVPCGRLVPFARGHFSAPSLRNFVGFVVPPLDIPSVSIQRGEQAASVCTLKVSNVSGKIAGFGEVITFH